MYLEESNRLRQLFTQIEYDHSEMESVKLNSMEEVSAFIASSSLYMITEEWVISRMYTVAVSNTRSAFMIFPNGDYFFVYNIAHVDGAFQIKISTFKVQGQLPVGSFVSSVGFWTHEREGQAANPSLHQIVGIFPPLK